MDYEKTHKWLTFSFNMGKLSADTWVKLGEAQSKCEHLLHSALAPEKGSKLHRIYLGKGALATTAIEGNTLSEEEVMGHLEGKLKLPPSKEYLGKEIDNIIAAFNIILKRLPDDNGVLSVGVINEFNKNVLKELNVEEDVIPGELRKHSVVVGRYRGAPAQDLDYLMQRLVDMLNSFPNEKEKKVVYGLLKAIIAHIYLVWIHPYGDGNGRTARLLETEILLQAGVPSSAAHLLSNHYNDTRTEYYRQLDNASRNGGNIIPFIDYAVQGFVDQIRGQIENVQKWQLEAAWTNYVYEYFKSLPTTAMRRRRDILLKISSYGRELPAGENLWPNLYKGKTEKTFARDLTYLIDKGLLKRNNEGYSPNLEPLTERFPIHKEQK